MQINDSVLSTTKNPTKVAKLTARVLLGNALGFRDCMPTTLDAMVQSAVVRTLGKGELLVQSGQAFSWLCLIVRGALETGLIRPDGHRHLVGFLKEGDVAGMISLADGLGHVHDLRSRDGATTVLLIPAKIITALKELDRQLGRAFELQLAFRSRLMYERLSADPSVALEVRLARLILALTGLYGVTEANGVRLNIKISQMDLADWLGVSRQRVNIAMQQLKTQAFIHLSYSTITVTNMQGLQQLRVNAGDKLS